MWSADKAFSGPILIIINQGDQDQYLFADKIVKLPEMKLTCTISSNTVLQCSGTLKKKKIFPFSATSYFRSTIFI